MGLRPFVIPMHLVRMMSTGKGFFAEVDDVTLARARRGDIDALEGLYRVFSLPVHTIATRICRSRDEAEEVLQETFLEVSRSIGTFRGEGALGAWVRRIAVSKALTSMRRRRRETAAGFSKGDVDHLAKGPACDGTVGWKRIDLERALARLPDVARAVVWLHDVEGFTHAEIAGFFGRSESFSKSQLSRAHEKLRSWLGLAGGTSYASDNGRTAGIARR
jgi:RNA polymerase sigma factor (sigma-70 family)